MSSHSTVLAPSYADFVTHSVQYFVRSVKYAWSGKYTGANLAKDVTTMAQQVTLMDLVVVMGLLSVLTFTRHYTTEYIFKPITKWRGVGTQESAKIPESAWKLAFYLTTWTIATYLIFGDQDAQYFQYPERVWQNYSVTNTVERGIYVLYMLELSFYIHSLYTTLLVDQRRKDTFALMGHHIICILLLTISYCNKSHKSGLLALFLHDGSDVLLESTKLIRYFKVQHGKTYHQVETFVNIGFGAFLLTWISHRLYWYPIKQVYMASVYVESQAIRVPFISFLVGMLWIILLMNYYWFSFALRLLYKVARGQLSELEDNREYNEAESKTDESDEERVIEKSDEEMRKFSVDSGVILLTGDGPSGAETERSNESSDDQSGGQSDHEKSKGSAPSSPSAYNLRQRKSRDYSLWR